MRPYGWLLLAGCASGDPDRDDTGPRPQEPVGGLVAVVRALDDGEPPEVVVSLGPSTAEPDRGHAAIFLQVLPGRAALQAHGDGVAPAWGVVDVPPHHLASTQLHPAPVAVQTLDGGAGALDLEGRGAVTVEAGALTLDGDPVDGPVSFEIAALGRARQLAAPAAWRALTDDEVVTPIALYDALWIAPAEPGAWALAAPATVELTLPEDTAPADELALYRFDAAQRYWRRAGGLTRDGDVVTGALSTFGWVAVGTPELPPQTCVVGVAQTPDGRPLPGAEVLLTDDLRFGARRALADERGRWCVAATPGSAATLRAWAIGPELVERYEATLDIEVGSEIDDAPGACDASCEDVGVLVLDPAWAP